jgi:hypothetical protein
MGKVWWEWEYGFEGEIKRSVLNMLSLGCLGDTQVEMLRRQLNARWDLGRTARCQSEKPECVRRHLKLQD